MRYMEVFNWGTFHGKINRLTPNCNTSLLTGANGSGKTTLVDALLTLLVPLHKRFYNQSSGTVSKRERDENSYFWGYYGKTYSELDERSKTEQLRSKEDNPYSVLLACFQNAATLHTITLVQVRWFSNSGLQKIFLVAPYQWDIEKNFGKGKFDFKGDWKGKLRRDYPKTDFFNSFKEYVARFSDLFGLKEKALSLFNQTVGIKVLGDLTPFIRQQMLEEPNAEEQFNGLHEHYQDLLTSHRAIQKDELQLQKLEPIMQNREKLNALRKKKTELDFIEEQMPFYRDQIELLLIDRYLEELEKEIAIAEEQQQTIETNVIGLEMQKNELNTQKNAYNIDQQVTHLRREISSETEKRNTKHAACEAYAQLAKKLGLSIEVNEKEFVENSTKANAALILKQQEEELLTEKKLRVKIVAESAADKINNLQSQIVSLQQRKNRIPDDLVSARRRLATVLETSEEELPFAGELLKVLPEESKWEDAIERRLHSFAMQLLIPDKFSKLANEFIHTNDMRTKLVYYKIDRKPSTSIRWATDNDALVNKLEFKNSIYKDWLESHLLERYNYHCTDDLEVFRGSQKAMTSNGLFRNAARHEKDDRPDRWNKSMYRLGWDNRDTIRYLLQEKQKLEQTHDSLLSDMRKLEAELKAVKEKVDILRLFAQTKRYDEINWKPHAERIAQYNQRIIELEQSSDVYRTIVLQLEAVEKSLGQERKTLQTIQKRLGGLETKSLDANRRKLDTDDSGLTENGKELVENFLLAEAIHTADIADLNALDDFNKKVFVCFRARKEDALKSLSKTEQDTTSLMAAFVHPGEKITTEFADWSGDVMNVSAKLESLDDLAALYDLIKGQRLIEHKRRFKDYMDRSMGNALTNYRAWLTGEEDKIREVIEELNVPLRKITFNKNPDTYLQLECKTAKDQDIKLFREQLNLAIPNVIEFARNDDDSYREQVFEKIKTLITELQEEEAWRKRVTDIRNWLTFSAREYTVVDNKPQHYHDSTASYSGGQKAQFTYAILGAAIAHQFGIFQQGRQHRSLRFITVDEAFSKLDPEKSRFLMEFCRQLNLQLLIVTPLDKINIAEPYINAVHYVDIKNQRHSILHDLTIEEYHQQKDMFEQLAATAK